jgi:hypothetical protein
MGSDLHTIVLEVGDFSGYVCIFYRNAMHSHQHTFAMSERRKNYNMTSLFFRIVGYMVLVGSILIPTAAFQGPAHPLLMVTMQLKGAYTRIQRLDEAFDLSLSFFVQYKSLEAKKIWREFTT